MKEDEKEQTLSLEDYAHIFLSKWYWFVGSVIIALCIGTFYLLRTTPVYDRTAQLLIHDDKDGKGSGGGALQEFKSLGLVASNTNINNEILTISAPDMMYEVMRRLGLDLQMETKEGLRTRPLYNDAPLLIDFATKPGDDAAFSFHLVANSRNEVVLSDFIVMKEELNVSPIKATIGRPVKTPVGTLTLRLSPSWDDACVGHEIHVMKYPIAFIGNVYQKRFGVNLSEKESTVLNLSVQDEIPDRADDVIMTLIDVYNENWIRNKNRIAESTNRFINERLENLTKELDNVDSRISDYKSTNLLPDVQAVLAKDMQQSGKNFENLLALNNQLSMAQFMRDHLSDKSKEKQLLPSNVGIENQGIEQLIMEYNRMMLDRMTYVDNSNEEAPAVKDLDRRLASQKTAIVRSIDNLVAQIKKQIANVERSDATTNSLIASNPRQAKILNSVQREQTVKESLYIYLLQKREENELSRTYTAWNTSIIQNPIGNPYPTSPRSSMIILIAIVLGLAAPAGILFLREMLDHYVRSRRDLDGMAIPFIGEVPDMTEKPHWWSLRKRPEKTLVVEANNRDLVNEAIRIIRTNLDYFIGQLDVKGGKVVMFTSFNPGSGKSFITSNLTRAISLKGKRILLIDLDLRKATQSSILSQKHSTGVANYLGGMIDDVTEAILPNALGEGADLLPVGAIPPNPAELLLTPRLGELIKMAREQYDYIILDCPPIEIVADASIIKEHADITIFVVRAGVMDKRLLPKVDELYNEKKFNNIALLLNGTECLISRYGSYRYGYGYGYGQGYSYGNQMGGVKW